MVKARRKDSQPSRLFADAAHHVRLHGAAGSRRFAAAATNIRQPERGGGLADIGQQFREIRFVIFVTG